ncbi:MAG TPA: RNA polymerase sigma factor [Polyangiaceae bacterium]|nr:RNA polymerase sigma factor [Polyangiaceae bacterium]
MSAQRPERAAERASPSDAAALAALADGDVAALGVLYDRHHVNVLAFLIRATGSRPDAEDLLHATFVTAAKAAGSFDGRETCLPWLLGIAARIAYRHRRGLLRWRRALTRFRATEPPEVWDPARQLGARDRLSVLARALERMSERKRIVLLLAEVEGLSGEQIAQALGVPIGTVWTRLHHARNELRRSIEEDDS